MTTTLRQDWKRFMDTGGYCTPPGRAACALRSARTLAEWRELEDTGVRIVADAEQENYFDVYGEPEAYEGMNGKRVSAEQARKEMESELERNGCWIVRSEYLTPAGEWEWADSIGMCMGYANPTDPFQNCYVPDLMHAALKAHDDAWSEAGAAL